MSAFRLAWQVLAVQIPRDTLLVLLFGLGFNRANPS
jgi:hypothetical protein